MNTLGKRIAIAREKLGLNQSELARQIDVTPQAVQKWEMDNSKPRDKAIDLLVNSLGVTKQWLLIGGDSELLSSSGFNQTATDFAFIPLYDVLGSCGAGYVNDHPELKSKLAFRKDWLKESSLQEKHLSIITAHGDSMWPTINEGAILLLNSQFGRLESGKVYALLHNGEVRVKRLFSSFTGEWRIASDNPNKMLYPDDTLSAEAMSGLHIIGRVVWAGSEL